MTHDAPPASSGQLRGGLPATSVLARIHDHVVSTPAAVAVHDDHQSVDYATLWHLATVIAEDLNRAGVGPEDVVAVLDERSVRYVVEVLAVLLAGAAFTPLETSLPEPRLVRTIESASIRYLLAPAQVDDLAGRLAAVSGSRIVTTRPIHAPRAVPAPLPPTDRRPDQLAYVIFTSGSTGAPKGAMVEELGMTNHLDAKIEYLDLAPGRVTAFTAPLSFDISVWQMLAPLVSGGLCAVAGADDTAEPVALTSWLARRHVEVLETVPSLLGLVLEEETAQSDPWGRLGSLMVTGEALPTQLAARWIGRFPRVPLINAYGPTECSDDVTHHVVTLEECVTGSRPGIGRPIPGARLHLLPETGRAWAPHPGSGPSPEAGEILVGGMCVGRGYLGDPRRTALAFVPDWLSENPGGRLYRTGDLAVVRDDGVWDYLGRRDRQVKVRGQRIELGDAEQAVLGCPGVAAASCVLVDGELYGFVQPDPGTALSTVDLTADLQQRVPTALVPHRIQLLARLPLTDNGKTDVARLEEMVRVDDHRAPVEQNAGSQTPAEEVLAQMARLIGVEDLPVDTHFFHHGGDSIRAMRLVAWARQRWPDHEISLADFMTDPTVPGLLAALRAGADDASTDERSGSAGHAGMLSAGQERLWFMEQLQPSRGGQLLRLRLRLHGRLGLQVLQDALDDLVDRHQPLRTRYPTESGRPVAEIDDRARVQVELNAEDPEHDLPDAPLLADAAAPLLRVRLTSLAADEWVLGIVVHHLVADGVSLEVLARDLGDLYAARLGHRAPPPAPPAYADYVTREWNWLESPDSTTETEAWRRELEGATTQLDLPLDRPRAERPDFAVDHVIVDLEEDLHQRIRDLATRLDTTTFTLVTAAWARTLARLAAVPEVVVGMDSANRSWPGAWDMVGTFVNQLPLRIRPGDDLSATVRDTSRAVQHAYRHERVPYHRIVAAMNPPRTPGRPPLFQVKVSQQAPWASSLDLPGLQVVPETSPEASMDLDLLLELFDHERMRISLVYRPELIDRTTACDWLAAIVTEFDQGTRAPSIQLTPTRRADD